MARVPHSFEPAIPPLAHLLDQSLPRQATACADGLGAGDTTREVVPFEAAAVQPIDPRLAWNEALAAVHSFPPDTNAPSGQAPPDWPALVQAHEPAAALAFALGNF